MSEKCPNCPREYKNLAQHWRKNSNCYFPSLSQKQWDIIIGLYLTRCSTVTTRHSASPYLQVIDTNKQLLDWLDKELGKISRGVRVSEEKERVQDRAEERGSRSPEEFDTVYQLETRTHPQLSRVERIAKHTRRPTPILFEVIYSRRGLVNRTGYVSFSVNSLRYGREFWEHYFSQFDATYSESTLRVPDLEALERFLGYSPIHEKFIRPYVSSPSIPEIYGTTDAIIDSEGMIKCPSCGRYVNKDVDAADFTVTLECSSCGWDELH